MKEREFRTQVFKTAAQWGSGLFHGLEVLKDGGCTLPSVPVVSAKIDLLAGSAFYVALAADCCGILYILDASTRQVYKYDPATGVSERIFCPENLDLPGRMVISRMKLWIVDSARGEIRACSLVHFQTIISIDLLEEPIDIAVNEEGDLFALDGKTKLIYRFDKHGSFICTFGKPYLKNPASIAVGKDDLLYAADKGAGKIIRFSKDGDYAGGGDFGSAVTPVMITGDVKGGGFLVTEAGEVYRFGEDGILAGKVRFPEGVGPVVWTAADGCGKLYASSSNGIYVLVSEKTFSTGPGFYYSKTLDSGTAENRWHRLVLQADIPSDTITKIYSYSSDKETLKSLIDAALTDPAKTTEEKAAFIDGLIPWAGPEENAQDILFKMTTGRFLWIKLELATYDKKARPTVKEMKVYIPRISYLRYLPAIYQEDAASKEFLERFLSLFESISYDLEVHISEITRYFDPDTTPPNFLKWLASWVDIAIEEDWHEKTKREFIRQATRLYTMKGTVEGIIRFIEIYTGKKPVLLEHASAANPVVLGEQFRLGINAVIVRTPTRGFRLGDDSIVGGVAIRDIVQSLEDPFLSLANRFTVVVDLTQEERARYEHGLRKIISDEKPAHTAYILRFAGTLTADARNFVGISTIVGGYDPLHLGSSFVGGGLLLSKEGKGGRVGERAFIGRDAKLS